MSEERPKITDWQDDCMEWRGRVLTGEHGHWCDDWDCLPVDETCEEWPCACHVGKEFVREQEHQDTIARLTRERDDAREEASTARAVAERAALAARTTGADLLHIGTLCRMTDDEYPLKAARRVVGERDELTRERDAALRWSRLWHSEARRLWREVQALSDPDQPAVEVDAEEWLRKLGGDQ